MSKEQEQKNNTMFDDDDIYSGLDEVETWDRLPWFEAGHRYLLKFESAKVVDSSNEAGVRFYVIEFEILESSCDTLPAGSRASHRIKITKDAKTRAYGPMNFRQFLSALTGIPHTNKDVKFGEIAKDVLEHGEFQGKLVRLQTNLNKAGTFTNHIYSYVNEDRT